MPEFDKNSLSSGTGTWQVRQTLGVIMKKNSIILLFTFIGVCISSHNYGRPNGNYACTKDSDTIVISKKITNQLAGGAYRKRATQYQIVIKEDTSSFGVAFTESNKNDFENEGCVNIRLGLSNKKSYKSQYFELAKIIEFASKEYNLDSLKSIYFLHLYNTGDLAIKISQLYYTRNYGKNFFEDYTIINQFFLESKITEDLNNLFTPYGLKVMCYNFEHPMLINYSYIFKESIIETDKNEVPSKILDAILTIYFEKIKK
jgi:hypothetical protein